MSYMRLLVLKESEINVLANSGDNGMWLCKNHHGLFDRNYYCFDSEFGKIVIRLGSEEQIKSLLGSDIDIDNIYLSDDIMNNKTKIFLSKRVDEFLKSSIIAD